MWLALLLACGQTAATAHLLSHFGAQAGTAIGLSAVPGQVNGELALDSANCALCLTATAVGTAAPPLQLPIVASLSLSHVAPYEADRGVASMALRLAYRSRAPPLSLR